MPKVTVLPVSTNNLQTSLFVDSSAYTSVIARYSIFVSVRPVDNYDDNQHKKAMPKLYCTRPGGQCISRENQAGSEQILKLLTKLLIFLMVNTFHSIIAGLKLRPG